VVEINSDFLISHFIWHLLSSLFFKKGALLANFIRSLTIENKLLCRFNLHGTVMVEYTPLLNPWGLRECNEGYNV